MYWAIQLSVVLFGAVLLSLADLPLRGLSPRREQFINQCWFEKQCSVLFCSEQFCGVRLSLVLCCTVQISIVLYGSVLSSSVLYCVVLSCIVWISSVMFCEDWYCPVLRSNLSIAGLPRSVRFRRWNKCIVMLSVVLFRLEQFGFVEFWAEQFCALQNSLVY